MSKKKEIIFICPHCGKVIEDAIVKTHVARLNGRKSRRKLSPEQARKMLEARKKKRGY